MSVWYSLADADGNTVTLDESLIHEGGTYVLGGSYVAEFNVTYNYGRVYAEIYDANGREYPGMIDLLHERSAAESISDLEWLASHLPDEPGEDYWQPTNGNSGHAIHILLRMARQRPEATWRASG